jgi:signal peptidase I
MGHGGRISWGRLILGGLLALVVAASLAVLIGPLILMQVYGGSNYRVVSDAMTPALLPGDWVLAKALTPGQAPPRGAIVVYEDPQNAGQDQVMRVMGLPGESIQMRGGALYVNGRRATMERLEDRVIRRWPPGRQLDMPLCLNNPVEINGECRQERWRETLTDGTSEVVLNSRSRIGVAIPAARNDGDNTPIFRVPGGEVFMLGDNRDRAVDSRFPPHGMVPIHKLRYRVWMIHTSLDRSARFLTPRWDRFFREVQ